MGSKVYQTGIQWPVVTLALAAQHILPIPFCQVTGSPPPGIQGWACSTARPVSITAHSVGGDLQEAGQDLSQGFPSLECSWSSQGLPFPSCGECLSAGQLSRDGRDERQTSMRTDLMALHPSVRLYTPVPAAQLFIPELSLESFLAIWAWNYFSLSWCELDISHANWRAQTNANYNGNNFGYKKKTLWVNFVFYFGFNGLVLLRWYISWILA